MPGQHIWHVKIRKPGEADAIFVGTIHQSREPQHGEIIEIEANGKTVRAIIVAIHSSHTGATGTFEIAGIKIEDDGISLGHREADEDDF